MSEKPLPPNQKSNQYVPKAGMAEPEPSSFKEASFVDPSSRSGPSIASGRSGSALKEELGIKSHDYSEGTLALDKVLSGQSGVQHDYSEGTLGVAWKQSGSSPSGPSGPNASGSANYSGPGEPRAPLHDYTVPNDDGTVGANTYEAVGPAADQEEEGEASYDPTYDKLHAFHPRPNPESATANENA